jgi:fumarate reductase subunit C
MDICLVHLVISAGSSQFEMRIFLIALVFGIFAVVAGRTVDEEWIKFKVNFRAGYNQG